MLNHQNNSSPPHPHFLYANLDELRDPYFQKVGRYVPPDPPVSPPVKQVDYLQRLLRLLLLTLFVKVVQGCKQECADRAQDKTETLNGETETFPKTADSDTFL